MSYRRIFGAISQHKRWLGAASVAGIGLGTTIMAQGAEEGQDNTMGQLRARLVRMQTVLGGGLQLPAAAAQADQQWRVYRSIEVQKIARQGTGQVLVTYKDGVYDLTEFAKIHPGGSDKLLMAKGGPIEPFWQMYPFHKHEHVIALLKPYQVGKLDSRDVLDEKNLPDFRDLQTQNLGRSDKLDLLQKYPYCAQTPAEYMTFKKENFLTEPREMFERNHNLIPEIEEEEYELLLCSQGREDQNPITLNFEDLKKMPRHSLMAAMVCAGSKRKAIQTRFPTVQGLKWTNGAAGNCVWTGVTVRHILLEVMGLREEDLVGKGLHLIAMGYDADFQGKHYEVSIPMENALDPRNEVMLAYEMNGEPLPPVHGFPVRMLSPGYIGVRSAKWLQKLIISEEMADSTPQRRDYKIVKDKDITKVDWSAWKCVYGQVINSAFSEPRYNATVVPAADDTVEINGWAHGNGDTGTQAAKVQLRFNGGDWEDAHEYMKEEGRAAGLKVFSWTLWRYKMPLSKLRADGSVTVEVRAIGSDGEVQDASIEDMYNVRGIMNNAFDVLNFTVKRGNQ